MSDDTISVLPDETGLVDMAELGCSPMLVTNGIVVYGSEVIKVDEVIVSGTLGEMVLNRTPEVPCLPRSVTPAFVASGCIKDKSVFEVTAWLSVPEILTRDVTSVIPGETAILFMAKLCCCPAGVANDVIFCGSEGVWLRIVEVIMSVTLDVKFVF